ncbi:MAG: hypothetical protein QG639_298 [Patescibacteria group bacterium]|jgi:hypothetical protein|nr:hypothetical protein [Patescibacteria group bacterium]
MAKSTGIRFEDNPGMMFVISFFTVALINFLVIWLANLWFPTNVVVGNVSLTPAWAAMLFGSALSLLTVLFLPFVTVWEQRIKRDLKPQEMMLLYLVFNFVSVWLLTRKSEVFGVGVTSWLVVLVLAVVFDIFQGLVMMQIEKWRLRA